MILLITRGCDYALRILRVLAVGNRFSVSQICQKEHIPQPFAYKLLKKLEKASIVTGYRGAAGGYRLIAPPQSLTLYDVYAAIEDGLYINECMRYGYSCPNNEEGNQCKVHKELLELQKQFIQSLRRRSMAEILNE